MEGTKLCTGDSGTGLIDFDEDIGEPILVGIFSLITGMNVDYSSYLSKMFCIYNIFY